MVTLRQFSEGLDSIPVTTSWYLADIGEAKGKHNPWHYINFVCFILKSAYQEFEERLGSLPSPRGEKMALIREAVNYFPGNFCVTDIQLTCLGVGIDMIRRVLKDLQAQGIIECLGRGRNAKWSKVEIR